MKETVKKQMAVRILWAAGILTVYALLYWLCQSTVLRRLPTARWTSRYVLLYCASVTLVPVLFGRCRSALFVLGSYIGGIMAGEVLGGLLYRLFTRRLSGMGIPYSGTHYGWLIWIIVFCTSVSLIFAVDIIRYRHSRQQALLWQ